MRTHLRLLVVLVCSWGERELLFWTNVVRADLDRGDDWLTSLSSVFTEGGGLDEEGDERGATDTIPRSAPLADEAEIKSGENSNTDTQRVQKSASQLEVQAKRGREDKGSAIAREGAVSSSAQPVVATSQVKKSAAARPEPPTSPPGHDPPPARSMPELVSAPVLGDDDFGAALLDVFQGGGDDLYAGSEDEEVDVEDAAPAADQEVVSAASTAPSTANEQMEAATDHQTARSGRGSKESPATPGVLAGVPVSSAPEARGAASSESSGGGGPASRTEENKLSGVASTSAAKEAATARSKDTMVKVKGTIPTAAPSGASPSAGAAAQPKGSKSSSTASTVQVAQKERTTISTTQRQQLRENHGKNKATPNAQPSTNAIIFLPTADIKLIEEQGKELAETEKELAPAYAWLVDEVLKKTTTLSPDAASLVSDYDKLIASNDKLEFATGNLLVQKVLQHEEIVKRKDQLINLAALYQPLVDDYPNGFWQGAGATAGAAAVSTSGGEGDSLVNSPELKKVVQNFAEELLKELKKINNAGTSDLGKNSAAGVSSSSSALQEGLHHKKHHELLLHQKKKLHKEKRRLSLAKVMRRDLKTELATPTIGQQRSRLKEVFASNIANPVSTSEFVKKFQTSEKLRAVFEQEFESDKENAQDLEDSSPGSGKKLLDPLRQNKSNMLILSLVLDLLDDLDTTAPGGLIDEKSKQILKFAVLRVLYGLWATVLFTIFDKSTAMPLRTKRVFWIAYLCRFKNMPDSSDAWRFLRWVTRIPYLGVEERSEGKDMKDMLAGLAIGSGTGASSASSSALQEAALAHGTKEAKAADSSSWRGQHDEQRHIKQEKETTHHSHTKREDISNQHKQQRYENQVHHHHDPKHDSYEELAESFLLKRQHKESEYVGGNYDPELASRTPTQISSSFVEQHHQKTTNKRLASFADDGPKRTDPVQRCGANCHSTDVSETPEDIVKHSVVHALLLHLKPVTNCEFDEGQGDDGSSSNENAFYAGDGDDFTNSVFYYTELLKKMAAAGNGKSKKQQLPLFPKSRTTAASSGGINSPINLDKGFDANALASQLSTAFTLLPEDTRAQLHAKLEQNAFSSENAPNGQREVDKIFPYAIELCLHDESEVASLKEVLETKRAELLSGEQLEKNASASSTTRTFRPGDAVLMCGIPTEKASYASEENQRAGSKLNNNQAQLRRWNDKEGEDGMWEVAVAAGSDAGGKTTGDSGDEKGSFPLSSSSFAEESSLLDASTGTSKKNKLDHYLVLPDFLYSVTPELEHDFADPCAVVDPARGFSELQIQQQENLVQGGEKPDEDKKAVEKEDQKNRKSDSTADSAQNPSPVKYSPTDSDAEKLEKAEQEITHLKNAHARELKRIYDDQKDQAGAGGASSSAFSGTSSAGGSKNPAVKFDPVTGDVNEGNCQPPTKDYESYAQDVETTLETGAKKAIEALETMEDLMRKFQHFADQLAEEEKKARLDMLNPKGDKQSTKSAAAFAKKQIASMRQISNVKISGSGRLPGLSCTFCMTPAVCDACPSITDFVRAS